MFSSGLAKLVEVGRTLWVGGSNMLSPGCEKVRRSLSAMLHDHRYFPFWCKRCFQCGSTTLQLLAS